MLEITNLFTVENLFNWFPTYSTQFLVFQIIFYSILIILAFVSKVHFQSKAKQSILYQELSNKIFSVLTTCGGIGLLLLFFEWQTIPYFSAAILIVILWLVLIIWLLLIYRYYQIKFKSELANEQHRKNYEKYLPENRNIN